MKDISYRVALGGIISALCLVTMFLSGIIPALYIMLPMVAGVLMAIIAVEVNTEWAMLTYTAVSILSFIITFDKEAALIFILLFGHYPILKLYIDKIKNSFLRISVKLLVFNVCVILYYYITVYFLGIKQLLEELDDFGKYGGLIMLVIVNIILISYDYNLKIAYLIYSKKFKPLFKSKK